MQLICPDRGFSVVADEEAITTFKTSENEKYPATVEEDQVV